MQKTSIKKALDREERLLISVGKPRLLDCDTADAREILAGEIDKDKFIGLARRHKVTSKVVHNLSKLQELTNKAAVKDIISALSQENSDRGRWATDILERELVSLSRSLSDEKIDHAFTKGANLMALYPDCYRRQLNDVDLLVRDIDQLSTAYDVLHKLGYVVWFKYENPYIRVRENKASDPQPHDNRAVSGHIVFNRITNQEKFERGDSYSRIQVEIYTAGQIAGVGNLESGIWDRLNTDDRGLAVPSREDAILILIAHNVKHGEYFLKDINDIYMLAKSSAEALDWNYIVDTAKTNGLAAVGALQLQAVNAYYGEQLVPLDVLRLMEDSTLGSMCAALSFQARNNAQLSASILQGPMIWAQQRPQDLLPRMLSTLQHLGGYVLGLPLEWEEHSRLFPIVAPAWRWLAGHGLNARFLDGRTYLIPIACVADRRIKVADLSAAIRAGRIDIFDHQVLLPDRLVSIDDGANKIVVGEDYFYLPSIIPYKSARSIQRILVERAIDLSRRLVRELETTELLQPRDSALNWYPCQSPFVAL